MTATDSTTATTSAGWNFADIYEAVAARVPDRPCQIQGDRVITWGQFDRRANALAADFVSVGMTQGSKVACYLYNAPEYMETMTAAFKVAMAPVNTNYRYGPDEIVYLFDNADAEAVVFHACFSDVVEQVRDRLTKVRRWYVVSDETGSGPAWATPYEQVVAAGADRPQVAWPRSGDGLLLLNVLGAGGNATFGIPPASDVADLVGRIDPAAPGAVMLSACPLMHGTGQFSALNAMAGGGAVVTLVNRRFSVEELFETIQHRRVTNLIIVGQAFAGPMLDHLEANPGHYDTTSLALVVSSGVMWSRENKAGLLRHIPQVVLFDSFGSSEAVGMGGSVSAAGAAEQTATFALGANCAVFNAEGQRVQPGSGEQGMVAVGGFIPLGYYKDEVKTASTFRTFEGRRWSVPGDWAEVNADGSLKLLGRGSVCINTGGEKVFPEEVEEALKKHTGVRDAVAVGLPDPRFGETICAVVEAEPGAEVTLPELAEHVKEHLAAYKAPRQLVVVDTIGRAPNGKVDYKRLKGVAIERLGIDTTGIG